ncbi:hypothetical protein SDC9_78071 [bioreactor metagenome]|uniref:Uncharacterized protein n=1 Tax=bioreactor metagenome TaxID=1076179 RepID=A0A644YSM9_9ZZZZ
MPPVVIAGLGGMDHQLAGHVAAEQFRRVGDRQHQMVAVALDRPHADDRIGAVIAMGVDAAGIAIEDQRLLGVGQRKPADFALQRGRIEPVGNFAFDLFGLAAATGHGDEIRTGEFAQRQHYFVTQRLPVRFAIISRHLRLKRNLDLPAAVAHDGFAPERNAADFPEAVRRRIAADLLGAVHRQRHRRVANAETVGNHHRPLPVFDLKRTPR